MAPPMERRHGAHLAVAAVSGLVVTVLEFGASRFMAPWFGQSNYIWSNVIGVILLALSLGYWMGGRIADRSDTGRPLYAAYLLAAVWAVGVAFLGPGLCASLVPQDLGSSRLLPLAFTGSLVATVVLFAPPVLVLGMTSPFLIRLDDTPGRTGRTAGRIFAVGTLGSLAGCYLAPLWLLQAAGSRMTILLCAATLAVLGGVGMVLSRRSSKVATALAASILIGVGGSMPAAAGRPLRLDPGQLAEVESTYQVVRVAEEEATFPQEGTWALHTELRKAPTRFLRLDEDAETYQSVVILPLEETAERLTGGRYYEHLALGAFFTRGDEPLRRLKVLIIGYAAGSVHRVLRAVLPSSVALDILGVEIDPAILRVAREYLWLDAIDRPDGDVVTTLTGEDGRTVINALGKDDRFDLIFIDAYTKTSYVPFQLATRECFEKLGRHLAPGGWLGLNLHAEGGLESRVFQAIARTLDAPADLGPVWVVPNPYYTASLLLWSGRPDAGPPTIRGDMVLPVPLKTPAFALERLMVPYDATSGGGHVLTDDKSDVDRLADAVNLTR